MARVPWGGAGARALGRSWRGARGGTRRTPRAHHARTPRFSRWAGRRGMAKCRFSRWAGRRGMAKSRFPAGSGRGPGRPPSSGVFVEGWRGVWPRLFVEGWRGVWPRLFVEGWRGVWPRLFVEGRPNRRRGGAVGHWDRSLRPPPVLNVNCLAHGRPEGWEADSRCGGGRGRGRRPLGPFWGRIRNSRRFERVQGAADSSIEPDWKSESVCRRISRIR